MPTIDAPVVFRPNRLAPHHLWQSERLGSARSRVSCLRLQSATGTCRKVEMPETTRFRSIGPAPRIQLSASRCAAAYTCRTLRWVFSLQSDRGIGCSSLRSRQIQRAPSKHVQRSSSPRQAKVSTISQAQQPPFSARRGSPSCWPSAGRRNRRSSSLGPDRGAPSVPI